MHSDRPKVHAVTNAPAIATLCGSIQSHPETSQRMQVYHGISWYIHTKCGFHAHIDISLSLAKVLKFISRERKERKDITRLRFQRGHQMLALSVPGFRLKSRTVTYGVLPDFDLEEVHPFLHRSIHQHDAAFIIASHGLPRRDTHSGPTTCGKRSPLTLPIISR